jgi:hypothetical protein
MKTGKTGSRKIQEGIANLLLINIFRTIIIIENIK